MKRVRCKCGVEHECAARLSNLERATKAARARLPRITHGKIDVAGAEAAPEPAGERRDEMVEMVEQPEVDRGDARSLRPDAVESAQEAQARKFIERHQKKPT